MRESDLVASCVDEYRRNGCDVHQEVIVPGMAQRADLIALKDPTLPEVARVWVVEAKVNLSLEVLGQAKLWVESGLAHYVLVAVPAPERTTVGRPIAIRWCIDNGVGILEWSPGEGWREVLVPEKLPARWVGRTINACTARTREQQGGTNNTRFDTPTREFMRQVYDLLCQHPGGLSTQDIVTRLPHPYRDHGSASRTLQKYLMADIRDPARPRLRPVVVSSGRPMRWGVKEVGE
jgi:hypothetical protein